MRGRSSTTGARMMRLAVIAATGATATTLMAPAASAATTSDNMFHGSCSIVGTEIASGTATVFHGHGTCIGSLNNGRVMAHSVVEVIRENDDLGVGGHMMPALHVRSSGIGSLTFVNGQTIRFAIQHTLAQFTVEGTRAGLGGGSITTAPQGALRLSMATWGGSLAG